MNYIKFKLVFCALIGFLPFAGVSQTSENIQVEATVRGKDNNPIIGASVSSADNSVFTDSVGSFSISIDLYSILKIEAPEYSAKTVIANPEVNTIKLDPLEDYKNVNVAFRKVEKRNLINGVSSVDLESLMKKNYNIATLQNMEGFANGFHGNIWGMDEYLVLIDGVPRDVGSVMPTEIEQITFLKGVSAVALYGSQAAKGVVQITTKRGEIQKQEIDVRINAGLNVPKSYPKYLGSAEYMSLYNEARANDGLSQLYDEETIYNYASGDNPYRYPDVNYYSSDYLQRTYNRYDATAQITGGNETAQYYTNLGFFTAGSLLDFGEAENNRTQRFNIRGNVDIDITDFLYATVNASAVYYNGWGVNQANDTDYWGNAASLRPNRFSPLIPTNMIEENDENSMQFVENSSFLIDGKYLLGGTQLDQTNPFAAIYAGGRTNFTNREFQFNTGIGADLGGIIKGLSFHSNFGVDYSTSYNQSYNNEYAVYQPSWTNYNGSDMISGLTQFGQDARSGVQNISDSWYRQTLSFSGQFDYETKIEEDHNISAMLIANGFQQSISQEYHRTSNANLGIYLGYDYLDKYFANFSGAFVHSAKLPEGNRQAFSPTLTFGWRLSEENFLRNSNVIDNLKLTASAGILHTDIDIQDYFLYQSIYTQTDGAWFNWRDGALSRSIDSRRGQNDDLTFAKREEINFGVEASLFDKLFQIQGSFFANRMTGGIVQASILYPNYFSTGWPNSSFIPYVNYNDDQRIGFDFRADWNQQFGNIETKLGIVGTYYETKATKRAELFEDAYQNRQGNPLDAIWGLESEGLFSNDEEIDNSASQSFGEVAPGDIKYVDQNGDGVIDNQDEVYLGKGGWYGAPFTLGVNFTAKWKNLTFFALGIGRFGAHAMKNNSYFWMDGEDKYSVIARDRWTPETSETATYPRLTTTNSNNNFRSSDFWLYSTDRFDLAKVQISYNLPKALFRKSFVEELGVYVNGANLLTISPEREILELNVGSAPQNRFYNLGLKAIF
ncbi:SusC/RagA family TonB-linked outer membrane protein [Zunongwangia endophytica]|uniref:SusC/RagA family TonB-linked outer membrane protein n=1 Tax=Zunongwangia endophytica TaxID=1808945 RepID=A0ABV8H531_9FLAO|nr:SusC/RagA family TonB-linked outer membrane protein [Zunongwangia endophytica]MDN3594428.1 SusC/RagA family TonB-linked outer membrane protein [Zunongwangia endophytica]